MRIGVIGAGPAGLFVASLLKERRPELTVDVFERNRADDSFGFGVVFSERTLGRLASEDDRLGHELAANARHWDRIEVRLGAERASCAGLGFSAIARRRLLELQQERARESGAGLHFERAVELASLRDAYDLVIAADGLNSSVRQELAPALRPRVDTATAKYIWFGAAKAFASMTFLFARNEAGWFAVHAYPYDQSASTFVVECDEPTWRRAGFDAFDAAQPPGPSDERTRLAMQELFADALDGAELLANNSRWASFRTVRADAWSEGRVAILGDAAHTAHFSVGSGTTMALEDALVLAAEVADAEPATLPDALARFESRRRPAVERIQDAAGPSLAWWEHFSSYTDLPAPQFALHFLTRSGRVSAARLAQADAEFTAEVVESFGARDLGGVLRTPLELADVEVRGRVVAVVPALDDREQPPEVGLVLTTPPDGGEQTLALLDRKGAVAATFPTVAGHTSAATTAAHALRLTAPTSSADVPRIVEGLQHSSAVLAFVEPADDGQEAQLAHRLTCELLRLQLGLATVAPADSSERAATDVLAGRTDFVLLAVAAEADGSGARACAGSAA